MLSSVAKLLESLCQQSQNWYDENNDHELWLRSLLECAGPQMIAVAMQGIFRKFYYSVVIRSSHVPNMGL